MDGWDTAIRHSGGGWVLGRRDWLSFPDFSSWIVENWELRVLLIDRLLGWAPIGRAWWWWWCPVCCMMDGWQGESRYPARYGLNCSAQLHHSTTPPLHHSFPLSALCSLLSTLSTQTILTYPVCRLPEIQTQDIAMSSTDLPILRPIPRRAFDLNTSQPPTPDEPIKRTKSTIALTSSTLFGIYSSTDSDAAAAAVISRNPSVLNIADFDFRESSNGRTLAPPVVVRKRRPTMPSGAAPMNKVPNRRAAVLVGALRVLSLFVFGVAYGMIVTHLHNTVASTTVDRYYIQWGLAGVALGSLLPWLDGDVLEEDRPSGRMAWDPVVRSIGAFVGIAYGIVSLFLSFTVSPSLSMTKQN